MQTHQISSINERTSMIWILEETQQFQNPQIGSQEQTVLQKLFSFTKDWEKCWEEGLSELIEGKYLDIDYLYELFLL